VNVVDQVDAYRTLIVKSFNNAMGTMERVHQASMTLSVTLLKELGVPEEPADDYLEKHGRMLHTVYSSVCAVNEEFGEMIVQQVENVHEFTGVVKQSWRDVAARAATPVDE
jgi:adenylosuccinate lyase